MAYGDAGAWQLGQITNLEARKAKSEESIHVIAVQGLVHLPHDLDVLLRHRLLPQPGGFDGPVLLATGQPSR